ncbi:hypothetical protein D7V90_07440 [bacterium 1xD42-87]|nr:hypothetical protein D7V90_07440 [bacterium 1xD42-87]
MSKTSPLYTANELYTSICFDCANELFEENKYKYKDEKIALIIMCHYLDLFFSDELYEKTRDNANFSLGNYAKLLNGQQYKAKNFTTYLVTILKDGLKTIDEMRENEEAKWSASDLKNKTYVLQSVGYDCFTDEGYTDGNRKFLFNTMADYLTDDVLEDPHKMQRVISLVKTTLQLDSIDKLINIELRKKIPDNTLIKSLTDIKDKLERTINSSASENGLSAKGSGKGGRGSTTLTNIMKEMGENGFEEIKVNLVDIKLSKSYQEIAADNAKALFDELNITSDEYAHMVAVQSQEMITLQDKIMKLEESVRLQKIEIKSLKTENENLKIELEGDIDGDNHNK